MINVFTVGQWPSGYFKWVVPPCGLDHVADLVVRGILSIAVGKKRNDYWYGYGIFGTDIVLDMA